jgi:hypothetical protein
MRTRRAGGADAEGAAMPDPGEGFARVRKVLGRKSRGREGAAKRRARRGRAAEWRGEALRSGGGAARDEITGRWVKDQGEDR